MDNSSFLLLNTSILYRSMQKYYDKRLSEYEIGAGQLLFLIMIYENEGISMQRLAQMGSFDKGTITKGIAKLEELGYVQSKASTEDKRVRLLYTSDKTRDIISDVYLLRREWWENITKDLSIEEIEVFERLQGKLADHARAFVVEEEPRVRIFGLQKLTLLDYPGKLASTVFTGGCNFRCPFCHNRDLVFLPENMTEIKEEDIMTFLRKRLGVLEGVCVSGGEPLLQGNIDVFLKQIKEQGYAVKLDTNGSSPEKLKQIVEAKLVDYVAMDIKNSPKRYGETIGLQDFDITPIEESIRYLKEGHVPYEFRTTIVKEFHTHEDIKSIGKWVEGGSAIYLQEFQDSERVIQGGLHACDAETMEEYRAILEAYLPAYVRGM